MSAHRPRIAGERRRPSGQRPTSGDLEDRTPAASEAEVESDVEADVEAAERVEDVAGSRPRPATAAPAPAPAPTLSRRAVVTVCALTALAVAAVAFAVVAYVAVERAESEATTQVEAEDRAVSAASAALEQILAYRYETVAADLEAAESLMTEEFADEYGELAPQITSAAEQRQIDVTASVRAIAALECGQECSHTSVRALAFVDQHRTLAGEQGSPAALSVVVRMEKVDDTWLVAEMTTS